jgi:hypothetical protein
VLTLQGGDVDMFSANGNISAGDGPTTNVYNPPVSLICNQSGLCVVNPSGLVTGAGIGALLTIPGQDLGNRDVTVAAPRGIIDPGAGGLRGATITIGGQCGDATHPCVIPPGGVVIGLPTQSAPPSASFSLPPADQSATKQAAAASSTTTQSTESTSSRVVIVQVLGYGGGGGPTGSTDTDPAPAAPDSTTNRSGLVGPRANSAPGSTSSTTGPDDKKKNDNEQQQAPAQP